MIPLSYQDAENFLKADTNSLAAKKIISEIFKLLEEKDEKIEKMKNQREEILRKLERWQEGKNAHNLSGKHSSALKGAFFLLLRERSDPSIDHFQNAMNRLETEVPLGYQQVREVVKMMSLLAEVTEEKGAIHSSPVGEREEGALFDRILKYKETIRSSFSIMIKEKKREDNFFGNCFNRLNTILPLDNQTIEVITSVMSILTEYQGERRYPSPRIQEDREVEEMREAKYFGPYDDVPEEDVPEEFVGTSNPDRDKNPNDNLGL